jgi:hypothetical protein
VEFWYWCIESRHRNGCLPKDDAFASKCSKLFPTDPGGLTTTYSMEILYPKSGASPIHDRIAYGINGNRNRNDCRILISKSEKVPWG